MRTPIVGGNWKMNTDRASGSALAREVLGRTPGPDRCDVVVYPPFPYLEAVGHAMGLDRDGGEDRGVRLGAQDLYHEVAGAFTGEVSVGMLRDVGVTHVLVGHSERRHVIGEDDQLIRRKLHAALDAGLVATLCIGETLEQREAGDTEAVNLGQLRAALEGVPTSALSALTIAYEPVWAIGTGRTASPDDAQAVHEAIRAEMSSRYDDAVASAIRIQYGGSAKPANAAELFAQPDIDGGLIGGASLDADAFIAIVEAAVMSLRP